MRRARIISIEVRQGGAGMLHATSPQMRELFVSARSLDDLREAVPSVIEAIFEAHGETVRALEAEDVDACLPMPWVIVPKAQGVSPH